MPLLPPLITSTPNNQPLYASSSGGGGGSQVLSQAGNSVLLSGGGGSVNIAATTLVAATGVKTTAMTYNSGILSTEFDGQVLVKNNLEVGEPLNPATLSVNGTVEPTSITDSLASVGTAGQVLSAGAGGSLEWVAAGGGGGSGTVTSVAVGANGLVLSGTPTVAPIISLPTASASVGQYLGTNAAGTFVVKGATVNLGTGSVASGSGSIAIGASASALANSGIAIGGSANMLIGATNGVAIGANATVGQNSTAVGYGNFATGLNSTAVGGNSDALGQGCISLGTGNVVTNDFSIGIGRGASTLNDGAIVLNGTGVAMSSVASSLHVKPVVAKTTETDVLFYDATSGLVSYGAGGGGGGLPATTVAGQYLVSDGSAYVTAGSTVHLGNGSTSVGLNSVAIGVSSASAGENGVATGINASASGISSIAIGNDANAREERSIAIGASASARVVNSIAINAGTAGLTTDRASLYVKPIIPNTFGNTNVLYYNEETGLVTYGAGGGGGGVASVAVGANGLVQTGTATDPILSLPTANASVGEYMVSDVTGKFVVAGDEGVALGRDSQIGTGVGTSYSIAVGVSASAQADHSIAIGSGAGANFDGSIVLNAQTFGTNLNATESSLYVKPILSNTVPASTDVLFYNPTSGLVTYGAGGGGGGLPATTVAGQYLVSNGSAYVTAGDVGVSLGQNSSIGPASYSVAIGTYASATGLNSTAIGGGARGLNANSIVLNAQTSVFLDSASPSLYVKPVIAKTTETDVLYYNATSGLVSYGAGGGGGGGVASVAVGANGLVQTGTATDPILSLPTASAVVGQYLVSDSTGKFVVAGDTVAVGNSSYGGTNSVAIGLSAGAGDESVSAGHGAMASGINSVALGKDAVCPVSNSMCLNATGASLSASTASLYVKPVIAKTTETDVLYYNATSGLVSYGAGGLPTTNVTGQYLVSNGSAYVTAGDVGVSLGQNSSIGASSYSVAIGTYASSPASNSIAIGGGARAIVNRSIVLNAQNGVFLDSASESLYVKPVISNAVPASTDLLYYNATSGLVSYAAPPAPFRATNTYYVAKNGVDTNTGAFGSPWLTIQHAISVIESAAPLPPETQEPIAIVTVAPGLYTENLTFTKGYIAITSLLDAQDANEITEVTGNISVAIVTGTSDIFNKQIILESLSITGNISDTSTIGHTLYLQNCYMYCSPASIGIDQSSTVDCRTRLNNLTMAHSSASADTNPLIKINFGDCYMNGCFLNAKSDAPAILISGSGAMSRCATSNFEYSYASVAGAIVRVTNTRLSTFGQCAFTATAGTVVALNVTTLGTPGTTGVFLLQCVIFVTGVATHAVTNVGYVYYGGNQSAPAIFGLGSGYSSNPHAIIFQDM